MGKTYAMLTAAHRAQKYGVDVVAGYVERHQRPETLALLDGLEQLPCRELEYKGLNLREFDLDGALARRPRLILWMSWPIRMPPEAVIPSGIRMWKNCCAQASTYIPR